jgi:ATP-dependent exoDNAse (exonuclease V) alpha subunit
MHLDLIKEKSKFFQMKTRGARNLVATLVKSCLSPEVLELKVGAKVMFTKNHPEGRFVNGTMGTVTGFDSDSFPKIRTNSGMFFTVTPMSWTVEEGGKVKVEIIQVPLRLAWAITVHKSQGMSLESMEVDLSKSFVKGMGYVALSRVRTLSGIKLLGLNEMALEVDRRILEKDRDFKMKSLEAVSSLQSISKNELSSLQKEWIQKIEPVEKKKITNLKKKSDGSYNEPKTQDVTKNFIEERMSLSDIAENRGLKQETIISHIEDLLSSKSLEISSVEYLKKEFKRGEFEDILAVFEKIKTPVLAPVFGILKAKGKNPSYLKIRLARLFV